MKHSTPPTRESDAAAEQSAKRPAWRFSGRRGRPVHQRDQTDAAKLPADVRATVTQLAREQSGETARPTGTPSARATNGPLRTPGERSAPPVAGAPMPVERRGESQQHVSTTPPEAVPVAGPQVPIAEIAIAAAAASVVVTETSVPPTAPETPPTPETPGTSATADAAAPERPKSRRSKAKAKARAKARAKAVREVAEHGESGERRLFSKGRVVDPSVEPVAIEEPTLLPVELEMPQPATGAGEALAQPASEHSDEPESVDQPAIIEVTAEAETEAEAEITQDDEPSEPTFDDRVTAALDIDVPLPEDILVPEGVWTMPEPATPVVKQSAMPTPVDTPEQATATPADQRALPPEPPAAGAASASQAAWELGRLPILLRPKIDEPQAADDETSVIWSAAATATADPEASASEHGAISWKPRAKPIAEPIELPHRSTPPEITALDALLAPRRRRELAAAPAASSTRRENTSVPDTTHERATLTRKRIAERRAQLDAMVSELDELSRSSRF
ncbi:MAG: hypothetical protein ABI200_04635 [Gaiellales bacterium]